MAALFDRIRGGRATKPAQLGTKAPKQSNQSSRFAAVALLLFTIILLSALVAIPAYLLHQRYDAEINRRNDSIVRYQRKAQERGDLQEKLDAVNAFNGRKFLLKETTLALAQTEVQNQTNTFIVSNGGRVAAAATPSPKPDGRYKLVIVQNQFYAKITDLRKILIAIESAEPHLFIDAMSVRSLQQWNAKPMPGFEPEMFVSLDVGGYMIEPEVTKPAAVPTAGSRTLSSKGASSSEPKSENKYDTKAELRDGKGVNKSEPAKVDASKADATKSESAKPDVKAATKTDMKSDSKQPPKADSKASQPAGANTPKQP